MHHSKVNFGTEAKFAQADLLLQRSDNFVSVPKFDPDSEASRGRLVFSNDPAEGL
jgi:hypothetical protein